MYVSRLLPSTLLLITAATYARSHTAANLHAPPLFQPRVHRRNAEHAQLRPGKPSPCSTWMDPASFSHIWLTLDDSEPYALKRIVLRMYRDGEASPSVETPIGDFFGLGNGIYYGWESLMLSAGGDKALNSYFSMPYAHHARMTITNEAFLSSLLEHRLPCKRATLPGRHTLLSR